MNGTPAASSRVSGAVVLASWRSDSVPSCIRAPPEALTTMAGIRSASAASKQRASFSPTTLPMLPPMKRKSKRPIATRCPSIGADPPHRRLAQPRLDAGRLEPVDVRLLVVEAERIARLEAGVALDEAAVVEEQLDPLADPHPEVVPAGGADAQVALQLLVEDLRLAVGHFVQVSGVTSRRREKGNLIGIVRLPCRSRGRRPRRLRVGSRGGGRGP